MASFVEGIWDSIFTPGTTPTLLIATNATFAILQVLLAAMLFATYSVHFLVLSLLSGGLWAAINWFARELAEAQRQEEETGRQARATAAAAGVPIASDESETEVEEEGSSSADIGQAATTGRGRSPPKQQQQQQSVAAVSKEVEPVETHGELKQRSVTVESATGDFGGETASQGTKSSVSTEDEWEKVSENENEKDK
ncbi:ER protein Pkr1-domain-containing protein [Bombardia bombarda]|uniref:ER protein Pkr1-domain-containing protein n=1 Tax=Bombardia bombarda TaxID=252184 RepID=A0AA39W4Z5_9PEZI|nr:ER protein Pkr1-domain-containing protein [Bombardia bombarda]